VINRYGMSEAFVISSLPLDGPWPQGSVGLPLEGIEVQVSRPDGSAAPAGEVGTVRLRGPNLFREYWRQPEATRNAFDDGWFDTGDLGTRDAAGFLTLVGRKHDLIITNGFNVYPQVVRKSWSGCSRVVPACANVRCWACPMRGAESAWPPLSSALIPLWTSSAWAITWRSVWWIISGP
jgi:acyl-CoA synthetase (AMP-forming)/AMP-acid ligase II